jgi:hypothetical protein
LRDICGTNQGKSRDFRGVRWRILFPGSGDGRSGLVAGVGIRGVALARCVSGVSSPPSGEEEGRVVVGVVG